MRPLFATLALAATVALAPGCRDVLTDSPPPPIAPAPPAGVGTVYLKGPSLLRVNRESAYRAEPIAGVAFYEWRQVGDGEVQIRFPTQDSRLPIVSGTVVGTVQLVVEAYSAERQLIAVAAKTITIQ